MHTTAAGFVVAPITRLAGIRQRVLIHHNAIGTNQGGLWVPLEKLYGATGMYSDIVFVSDRSHELISDWPDPYLKRASVIFNGIELPAPESQMTRQAILERHGLSPDTLLAISVGSLEAQKNQRVLVEALAGTSGVHLIIAGEGSKRPEIESAIKRTNAPVTLLGNIEMEEVSALFHECDVLLFPSIHEGRALTLLEAADSGIGIIASDIPENVSVLGPDGHYVGANDIPGWRNEIEELVKDRAHLQTLREHTATLALPTLDEMVDQYETIITS